MTADNFTPHRATDKMPRVVSFSGGRSSGMMLARLIETKQLKAARGDCVVFTNTSAEHPATYDFIIKTFTKYAYKIPCFVLEYATYERERKDGKGYMRDSSYILRDLYLSDTETDNGMRWRGEVYEEMLSFKRFLPSYYQRVCTVELKVSLLRKFLLDYWTRNNSPALGTDDSTLTEQDLLKQYQQKADRYDTDEAYLNKCRYVLSKPKTRPSQSFMAYHRDRFASAQIRARRNIKGKRLARGEIEYVDMLGIRADEPKRVASISANYNGETEKQYYSGEWIDFPLAHDGITKQAVLDYWSKRFIYDDLKLPQHGLLSNCTFCFLKGTRKLKEVYQILKDLPPEWKGTPMDIDWWAKMERIYGKPHAKTHNAKKDAQRLFPMPYYNIGFFGVSNELSYFHIANQLKTPHESEASDCRCNAD